MKGVSVTLFVHSDSFTSLVTLLKVLTPLSVDDECNFKVSSLDFSEATVNSYIRLNIPIELYIKFRLYYEKRTKQQ